MRVAFEFHPWLSSNVWATSRFSQLIIAVYAYSQDSSSRFLAVLEQARFQLHEQVRCTAFYTPDTKSMQSIKGQFFNKWTLESRHRKSQLDEHLKFVIISTTVDSISGVLTFKFLTLKWLKVQTNDIQWKYNLSMCVCVCTRIILIILVVTFLKVRRNKQHDLILFNSIYKNYFTT